MNSLNDVSCCNGDRLKSKVEQRNRSRSLEGADSPTNLHLWPPLALSSDGTELVTEVACGGKIQRRWRAGVLDERRQFWTGIARPDLKTHINAQHPPNTHHANGLRHKHPLAHTTRPGLPESKTVRARSTFGITRPADGSATAWCLIQSCRPQHGWPGM